MENIFLNRRNGEKMNIVNLTKCFKSHVETGMCRDVKAFLEGENDIIEYSLKGDNEKIIISVQLSHFSVEVGENFFRNFVQTIGYQYMNMYVKEYEKEGLKFAYFTAMEDMEGVEMEIRIK